jgi:hypothetical protein
MKKAGERYTIAVDFDGVIHQYVTPWVAAHIIPDPPIPGAIEWLSRMIQKFDIVIATTRGNTIRGRIAVYRWLYKHGGVGLWYEAPGYRGLEDILVKGKPVALVYLGDRAMRFAGDFPTPEDIHAARPWKYVPAGRER